MTDNENMYSTQNQGLAAFLIYVLSEDAYSHAVVAENQRPVIWFQDVTADNSCAGPGPLRRVLRLAQGRAESAALSAG